MGGTPSKPADRSRTLQVIGAGYSRTGTVSMAMALEKLLDGPAFHGGTQLLGREDAYVKLWCKILVNRHDRPVLLKSLREATAGFVAMTDAPGIFFLPELLEIYPDAKVVLVTRDPTRWFASMMTIIEHLTLPGYILGPFLWLCPTWRWMSTWLPLMGAIANERTGSMKDETFILEYNEIVRSQVPADRLLTMEIKDGWEPLAKFLNKPVPKEPFPRANDAEAVNTIAKTILCTASISWAGALSGIGLLGWGGWFLCKQRL